MMTGNNWGWGPQSAEVQTVTCLAATSEAEAVLGCGPQETFRGCADICVGDFCPLQDQETCIKVSDVGTTGTNLDTTITTAPTTLTTTTTTTTATVTTTTTTTTEKPQVTCAPGFWNNTNIPNGQGSTICEQAGVTAAYFSLAADRFCKYQCLNKTVDNCFRIGNTQKICFCIGFGDFKEIKFETENWNTPLVLNFIKPFTDETNELQQKPLDASSGFLFGIRGGSNVWQDASYPPIVIDLRPSSTDTNDNGNDSGYGSGGSYSPVIIDTGNNKNNVIKTKTPNQKWKNDDVGSLKEPKVVAAKKKEVLKNNF